MAECVLAVLALKKTVEVVVSAADVAGLVHGVLQLLTGDDGLNVEGLFSFPFDLVVRGSTVGTLGGKTAAFLDALEAEEMPTGKFSFFVLLHIV